MIEKGKLLPYSRPHITSEDLEPVIRLMLDGKIDAGPVEAEFRRLVAERYALPASWVQLTNSCTSALEAVYDFLRPDEVHSSVLTWPSSYSYVPIDKRVLNDVYPRGLCQPAKHRLSGKCALVLPELWGRRVRIEELRSFRALYDYVILDSAQDLFDSNTKIWLKAGLVDAVCLSFGPLKQITTGHGGAVIMKGADKMLAYCDSGTIGAKKCEAFGRNLQMMEPAAQLGIQQLARFDHMQTRRQRILAVYCAEIEGMMTRPSTHSGHLAVLKCPSPEVRQKIREALFMAGVATSIHYTLPTYIDLTPYPIARQLESTILTLPCHMLMDDEDARRIGELVQGIVKSGGAA